MLCNSYSNRFYDFYISPIVKIGAMNFQSKKTLKQPIYPCFRVTQSSLKQKPKVYTTRVTNLSLTMYLFSISIDELSMYP